MGRLNAVKPIAWRAALPHRIGVGEPFIEGFNTDIVTLNDFSWK